MKDKLLILDLDGLLVHTIWVDIDMPSYSEVMFGTKIMDNRALLMKRNHLKTFISYIMDNFKVGIWSDKGERYVDSVLKNIGIDQSKLEFVYNEYNCSPKYLKGDVVYLRNIEKLVRKGYDLNKILILNSNPKGYEKDCENTLKVKIFYGEDDDELLKLIDYLDVLKFRDNLKIIKKKDMLLRY